MKGKNKRYLRSLGNRLEPVVMIGQGGMTASVIRKIDDELNRHELIKIRFVAFKDQKDHLVEQITQKTGSESAGSTGHTVLLYRRHPDKDGRKISLPVPE